MLHFGTVAPGSTLTIPFDTFAGATGASITMTGFATSDIKVYKDGSTTERASTSGYTLLDTDGTDFDGLTGIHGFSIDLSDNTTAGFWAAGSAYFIVISTITVDSQTVSFVAASFRIGYPGALHDTTIATLSSQTSFTLATGPAEDDALNGCVLVLHDVASAVQRALAVVADYTGATKTVTLVAAPTYTLAATDNVAVLPPALQPTLWGRTLDVAVTGEAGLDFSNIKDAGSAHTLTNITVPTVTGVTNAVTVGTNTDKSGYSLSAAGIQAIWDALTSALSTASSIGKLLVDNINATISSRLASSSYTAPDNSGITAIKSQTDQLAFTSNRVHADAKALNASTTAAANLSSSAQVIYSGTVTGASPTTTTLVDTGLGAKANDFYKGRVVIFLTGALKYQATNITAYTGSTDTLTFTALTAAPAQTDTYVML
jgi:hypothetical protein